MGNYSLFSLIPKRAVQQLHKTRVSNFRLRLALA